MIRRSCGVPKLPQRHFWGQVSYILAAQLRPSYPELPFPGLMCYCQRDVIVTALGSVGLASGVGLSTEVGSGRAGLGEVAGEDRLEEGSEDDLGTTRRY